MPHPLSARAREIKPSMTMAITAKAKSLAAKGVDICSFSAGEPDFRTPDHICAAAKFAIDNGLHGYLANAGMPELRTAVTHAFMQDIGVHYDAAQTLVSPGGKCSLALAFLALLDPGDEVLLPSPYWVSYVDMVHIAGGVTKIVPTQEDNGFLLTAAMLEPHITPRTKLLILNSPCNPTGAVIHASEIREIAALLERHGLFCISDEIYDKLLFGGATHTSIASVSPYAKAHTVVVNGCSKAYAMTGWRIGYAAGPLEVIQAMANLQSQMTSNACSIAQAAALAALEGSQECVETMRQAFEKRRDLIVALLNDIDGVRCTTPEGAFYVLPDIRSVFGKTLRGRTIQSSMDFCDVALEAGVACVPGEAFGTDHHVRLSYATGEATIRNGCLRLKELIDSA